RGTSRSLSVPPVAVFGNLTIAGRGTGPSSTNRASNRSAPSRLILRIRKTYGSAQVNRGRATAFRLVTESINQQMAVKRGRILVWKSQNAFRRSLLIREIATPFSPQFPAHCGAIRPTAVSTKQPMAARHGNKSLREQIFPLAAQT